MRTRIRTTLLLLLGTLGSGLLLLALDFGRGEGPRKISGLDGTHDDREQQQYWQHEVPPGDSMSANGDASALSAWTRISSIWKGQKEELKTYPNLAQCQILHHRNSSANITDITLLLDPKRFSRFRNIFDVRCLSLHRALLAHLRTQQSKELLNSFVCGSSGSWKTSVFFQVLEADVQGVKRLLREWAPEVRWEEERVCEKGVMGTGQWERGAVWKRDPVPAFIGSNHNPTKPTTCSAWTGRNGKSTFLEVVLGNFFPGHSWHSCDSEISALQNLGWQFVGTPRCTIHHGKHTLTLEATLDKAPDPVTMAKELGVAFDELAYHHFVCLALPKKPGKERKGVRKMKSASTKVKENLLQPFPFKPASGRGTGRSRDKQPSSNAPGRHKEIIPLEKRGIVGSTPQKPPAKTKSTVGRPLAGMAIYHGFQGTNQNKEKPSICQFRTSPHHKGHLGIETKLYRIPEAPKKDPCPQVKKRLKQLGWNFGGVDKGFRCVYSAQEHAMSMLAIINEGNVDKKNMAMHLETAWEGAGLEYMFVCFDDDEETGKAKMKVPERPNESLLFPGWNTKIPGIRDGDRKAGGADHVSRTLFAEPEEYATGNDTLHSSKRDGRVAGECTVTELPADYTPGSEEPESWLYTVRVNGIKTGLMNKVRRISACSILRDVLSTRAYRTWGNGKCKSSKDKTSVVYTIKGDRNPQLSLVGLKHDLDAKFPDNTWQCLPPDGQRSQQSNAVAETFSSSQAPPAYPGSSEETLPPYSGSSTPDPGQDGSSAVETRGEDHVGRTPPKTPKQRCIAYDVGDEVSGHADYYIDIQLSPAAKTFDTAKYQKRMCRIAKPMLKATWWRTPHQPQNVSCQPIADSNYIRLTGNGKQGANLQVLNDGLKTGFKKTMKDVKCVRKKISNPSTDPPPASPTESVEPTPGKKAPPGQRWSDQLFALSVGTKASGQSGRKTLHDARPSVPKKDSSIEDQYDTSDPPPPYSPHPPDGKKQSVKPIERRGQSQSTGSRPTPTRIRGKCLVTDIGSTYFSIWRYDIEIHHPTKKLSLQSTCRSLEKIVKKKSHIANHVECDSLEGGKGVHFIISGDKHKPLDLVGLTHELEEKFPFNDFKCLASAPRYLADASPPDYIDVVYGRLRRTGCLVYKHTVPNHPTIQYAQVMAIVPGVPYSEAECDRARGTWGRRHGDYDRMWMCKKIEDPDPQRSGGIYISAMGSVDLFTDPRRANTLLQEVWYGPTFDCKPVHEFDGS